MYYRVNGQVVGVLNDYDVASLKDDPPLGNQRTGTIPFMALDLLQNHGQKGIVKHVYRHDLESFIWVLVWLTLQYKDGQKISGPLDEWAQQNPKSCYEKKWTYFRNLQGLPDHVVDKVTLLYEIESSRIILKLKLKKYQRSGVPPSPEISQRIEELETQLSEVSPRQLLNSFGISSSSTNLIKYS